MKVVSPKATLAYDTQVRLSGQSRKHSQSWSTSSPADAVHFSGRAGKASSLAQTLRWALMSVALLTAGPMLPSVASAQTEQAGVSTAAGFTSAQSLTNFRDLVRNTNSKATLVYSHNGSDHPADKMFEYALAQLGDRVNIVKFDRRLDTENDSGLPKDRYGFTAYMPDGTKYSVFELYGAADLTLPQARIDTLSRGIVEAMTAFQDRLDKVQAVEVTLDNIDQVLRSGSRPTVLLAYYGSQAESVDHLKRMESLIAEYAGQLNFAKFDRDETTLANLGVEDPPKLTDNKTCLLLVQPDGKVKKNACYGVDDVQNIRNKLRFEWGQFHAQPFTNSHIQPLTPANFMTYTTKEPLPTLLYFHDGTPIASDLKHVQALATEFAGYVNVVSYDLSQEGAKDFGQVSITDSDFPGKNAAEEYYFKGFSDGLLLLMPEEGSVPFAMGKQVPGQRYAQFNYPAARAKIGAVLDEWQLGRASEDGKKRSRFHTTVTSDAVIKDVSCQDDGVRPESPPAELSGHALMQFEQQALADYLGPRVAQIFINPRGNAALGNEPGEGTGSGFICQSDGLVVTNHHVVEGVLKPGGTVTVMISNTPYDGRIVDVDEEADLAFIKVESDTPLNFPTARFSEDRVRQGDVIFTMGNPLGISNNFTPGTVRKTLDGTGFSLPMILTTSPIYKGDSGGGIFAVDGGVKGLNRAIHQAADSLSFAIPPFYIEAALARLAEGKTLDVPHMKLGVKTHPFSHMNDPGINRVRDEEERGKITAAREAIQGVNLEGQFGLVVYEVEDASLAKASGLQVGDTIVKVDGENVGSHAEYLAKVTRHFSDEDIVITVKRPGVTGLTEIAIKGSEFVG